MKKIAIIFTIIGSLLFFVTEDLLNKDSIGKSDKFGAHFFNFLIFFSIPILLWITYFIIEKYKFQKGETTLNNKPSVKKTFYKNGNDEPRPSFLTVLCILSFIFIGLSLLFGLMGLVNGPMNEDQLLESSVQISKSADEMRSLDMESFAIMMEQIGRMTVSINNHFYVNGILSLVVMITGLIGVIKMIQGHKIGFHLYIIYSLITIGQLYIFVSPADIPSFVVIWNLVISGIFILMYSRNLKWLK